MKIALVSPYDYLHPGGVNNHVAHLAERFRRWGHEVWVVAPVPADAPVPEGVYSPSGHIIGVPSGGSRSRISLSPRSLPRVRRLLEEGNFDVVHLHNPLSPLISINFLYLRDVAPRTTMVATFHEYRADDNLALEYVRPMLRHLVDRLDGRIAVSRAALRFNLRYFPGDYVIIPNGIDVAAFSDPTIQPIARYRDGRPNILFVGRLEKRKGFKYLLRAFRCVREAIPNARLLVVGAYTKKQKRPFLVYARKRRLHGVRFVGPVSDEMLPRYYRTADLFCAPSTGYESFGIVLLEAMASGLPIVASDIEGYREVLDHGVQGLLVPPRDPEALATVIVRLLQDPRRRAEMGRQGRIKAAAYSWDEIARRVLAFYEEVRGRREREA